METNRDKSSVFSLLNFDSVESMNTALLELSETLSSQGKAVPQDIKNADKTKTISKASLQILRDSQQQPNAIAGATESEPDEIVEAGELTITDDAIESLAADKNIDLFVVIDAAEKVQNLALLVQWAEEYQRQKLEIEKQEQDEAIKESVSQQIRTEKLKKQEDELKQRLINALNPVNKKPFDVKQVERMLNIQVPESVKQMASYNLDSEDNVPDFLKQARENFAKLRA
jgi:hypothetical protein